MLCSLCHTRKARRHCPALGRQICAVCCGTKRLVEIACPPDCVYLASARTHPPAAVKRQRERDGHAMLSLVQGLSRVQYELFVLLLPIIEQQRSSGLLAVKDADIADGAAALAATYETSARGLIYEHHPQTLPAQRFVTDVGQHLSELTKNAPSSLDRDLAAALRRIEKGAREAPRAFEEGDEDTAFMDLVGRLLRSEQTSTRASGGEGAAEERPRLIVPQL